MPFVRRFLPSVTFLCSFEAAARHLNFTVAARELNLTQSAISRHIRLLEERLGTALFVRDRQTVRLTRAGEIYVVEVRSALETISQATLGLRACPSGQALDIAIDPTFGARWLLPALQKFYVAYPEIKINIFSDLSSENADIYIRTPSDEDQDFFSYPIASSEMVPVCSPSLLEKYKIENIEDLSETPLLHLTSKPDLWERWFEGQSFYPDAVNGNLFDQYSTLLSATESGIGISLVPEIIVKKEIFRGDLVVPKIKFKKFYENYNFIYSKNNEMERSIKILLFQLEEFKNR